MDTIDGLGLTVVVMVAGLFFIGLMGLGRYFVFRYADIVDTHRTRIPLLLATAASGSFCIAWAFIGVWNIDECYASCRFWPGGALGIAAVLPLVSSVLSYLVCIRSFRKRIQWSPCENRDVVTKVQRLAERMGLTDCPRVVVSSTVVLPLILGRTGRAAVLVLPAPWFTPEGQSHEGARVAAREFQICHELAHLRNGDMAFTTLAYTFVRSMGAAILPMVLLTWGILAAGDMSWTKAVGLTIPPLAAFLQLSALYCIVLRNREFDADARVAVAMGWGSSRIVEFLDWVDPLLLDGRVQRPAGWWNTLRWRLTMWSTDKAVFGKPYWLWRILAGILSYIEQTHPSVAERRSFIQSLAVRPGWSLPSIEWGVWTGLVLGLTLQGLLFFFAGISLLATAGPDSTSAEILSKEIAAPIWLVIVIGSCSTGAAFVALLPSRFSDEAGPMPLKYLARLAVWLVVVGVSADGMFLSTLPLMLDVLPLVLVVVVLAYIEAAMVASIVAVFRGKERPLAEERRIVLVPVIGYTLVAGVAHLVVPGIIIPLIAGLLIGILLWGSSQEEFSWGEGYNIRKKWGREWRVEGKAYRRARGLGGLLPSFFTFLGPSFLTSVTAGAVYCAWRGDKMRSSLTEEDYLFMVIGMIGVLAVVTADYARLRRLLMPQQLRVLSNCCEILFHWQPAVLSNHNNSLARIVQKVDAEHPWAGRVDLRLLKNRYNLIMCHLALRGATISKEVASTVLHYESAEGGFGVWPGASPRLSSTYTALSLLEQAGGMHLIDKARHLRWLRILQRDDGTYSDPLLRYPLWKQTFWGMRCFEALSGEPCVPSSPSLRRLFAEEVRRGLGQKHLGDSLWESYSGLQMVGVSDDELEEALTRLCEQRLARLTGMRTSWVVEEYRVLVKLSNLSAAVAQRLAPYMPAAIERVNEALGAVAEGVLLKMDAIRPRTD